MSEKIFVLSDGRQIPIVFTTKRGSRNIILRPKILPNKEIQVSLPRYTSVMAGLKFIEQKNDWLENIFKNAPEKVQIKSDDVLFFLGKSVIIRHDSNHKSNFYLTDSEKNIFIAENGEHVLIIGGVFPELLESRLREFIKKEFLAEVEKIIKTVPPSFRPKKLATRDNSSCWGSCSSSGTMTFSWRLAFAPSEVMRYVVMHELAHKKYMDHSPKFWNEVAKLYGSTAAVNRAKAWLAKNGAGLYVYF